MRKRSLDVMALFGVFRCLVTALFERNKIIWRLTALDTGLDFLTRLAPHHDIASEFRHFPTVLKKGSLLVVLPDEVKTVVMGIGGACEC